MEKTELFSHLLLHFLLLGNTLAAPGDLDSDFGNEGLVLRDIGKYATARSLVKDREGRILVAGEVHINGKYDFLVERYLSNGLLDLDFGVDGSAIVELGNPGGRGAWTLALGSDGRIIVGGQVMGASGMDFGVLCLEQNGALDPTFSGDGKLVVSIGDNDYLSGLTTTNDGAIYLSGTADQRFALVKLDQFGQLDKGFSEDGVITDVRGSCSALAIDNEGRLVLGGWTRDLNDKQNLTVLRFLPNGGLDLSFSEDGRIELSLSDGNDSIEDIAIQDDGKIVVTGSWENIAESRNDLVIARFDSSGSLDMDFASGGFLALNVSPQSSGPRSMSGRAIAIAPDGKVLVGGHSTSESPAFSRYAFVRVDRNGTLDPTFGDGGSSVLELTHQSHFVTDLTLGRDGDITVTGVWAELEETSPGTSNTRTKLATLQIEGDKDTDLDGLPDYAESDTGIFRNQDDTGTDPFLPDSDEDGLLDGLEVFKHRSDPNSIDSDRDGYTDDYEVENSLSPIDAESIPNSLVSLHTPVPVTIAVELRVVTQLEKTYCLQTSEDLKVWEDLNPLLTGTGRSMSLFRLTDGLHRSFWRLKEVK